MVSEHYFASRPASEARERELEVDLRGRRVRVRTSTGVFSGDRLDLGTRVLLDHVPDPPSHGDLLDLGCGWGPVALALAAAAPEATVWAVDVNERARELTRRNAEALGHRVRVLDPDGALAELGRVDVIWSNPPVRVGKGPLRALLRTWLGRLGPEGEAYVVVQRNLGADSLHRWLAEELRMDVGRVASSKGFRVLRVRPGD